MSRRSRKQPKPLSPRNGGKFYGSALIFAALGDETRLRLVSRLCARGPMSISALTAGTRVTRQAITKHLRLMQGAGVVHSHRRGRERLWEINERRLGEARQYLELISQHWDAALIRLRDFVER
jgi:DNA-binding transcriptional ArsR family regulator